MHLAVNRYAERMDGAVVGLGAGLELKHLRCLVAIVDTGSFTDAGIELGLSQAAVSRAVLALERTLGVRLLHRTSRSVSPTTARVPVLARGRGLLARAGDVGPGA